MLLPMAAGVPTLGKTAGTRDETLRYTRTMGNTRLLDNTRLMGKPFSTLIHTKKIGRPKTPETQLTPPVGNSFGNNGVVGAFDDGVAGSGGARSVGGVPSSNEYKALDAPATTSESSACANHDSGMRAEIQHIETECQDVRSADSRRSKSNSGKTRGVFGPERETWEIDV